ncbi:hypothetical protein [Paenibacillus chitinolyticus]
MENERRTKNEEWRTRMKEERRKNEGRTKRKAKEAPVNGGKAVPYA